MKDIIIIFMILYLLGYVTILICIHIILPLMGDFIKHREWCLHGTNNILTITTRQALLNYKEYKYKFIHNESDFFDNIILNGYITNDGIIVIETSEFRMNMCELGTEFMFYNRNSLIDTYIITFTKHIDYVLYKLFYKRTMIFCKKNNIQEVTNNGI